MSRSTLSHAMEELSITESASATPPRAASPEAPPAEAIQREQPSARTPPRRFPGHRVREPRSTLPPPDSSEWETMEMPMPPPRRA